MPRTRFLLLSCCILAFSGTTVAQVSIISGSVQVDAHILDIAVDADGNTYVVGTFFDPVQFGPFLLTSHDPPPVASHDAYVAKLSPSGDWVWARSIGTASSDVGYAVALNSSGALCVAISSLGSPGVLRYGEQEVGQVHGGDLVVLRLDTDGNFHNMTSAIRDPDLHQPVRLAVNEEGTCFLAGSLFDSSIQFGADTFAEEEGLGFIAALDPDGSWAWVRTFTAAFVYDVNAMHVDPNGHPIVAVDFSGELIMGDDVYTGNPLLDDVAYGSVFLAKWTSAGLFQWGAVSVNTPPNFSGILGFTPTADGGAWISGSTRDEFTAGPFELPQARHFHARVDGGGNWTSVTPYSEMTFSLTDGALLENGEALFVGYHDHEVHFGELVVPGDGTPEGTLALLGADGEWIAAEALTSTGFGQVSQAVSNGPWARIRGYFQTDITIGATHHQTGDWSHFIALLERLDVGMEEVDAQRSGTLILGPVPTTDRLRCTMPEDLSASTLRIVDMHGREVMRAPSTGPTTELDVSSLAPGSYILQAGTRHARFVKY